MKILPFLSFIFLFAVSCKDSVVVYDACGYFEAEEWVIAASAAGKIVAFDVEQGNSVTANARLGLIDTVQLQLQKDLLLLQPKSKARDIQEKQINYQLKQCVITAVASGIITEKYARKGEVVAVGFPLGKIADIENMYLRMYVTAAQVRRIRVGQEVEITLDGRGDGVDDDADAGSSGGDDGGVDGGSGGSGSDGDGGGSGGGGGGKYMGKIEWVSPIAEFTPKTIQTEDERQNMVYAVKVAVKNDGNIKIGSYAEVKF
jgi:multidrug efflux pump subunit AcrA (membrane-fusion protein)